MLWTCNGVYVRVCKALQCIGLRGSRIEVVRGVVEIHLCGERLLRCMFHHIKASDEEVRSSAGVGRNDRRLPPYHLSMGADWKVP